MIGKTIKFLRMTKGLKQQELANLLKVSTNYISLLENDKREPSFSFLKELANILEIPVGLLLFDLEMNKKEVSPQERDLLIKMRDIMLQLERVKLQQG